MTHSMEFKMAYCTLQALQLALPERPTKYFGAVRVIAKSQQTRHKSL